MAFAAVSVGVAKRKSPFVANEPLEAMLTPLEADISKFWKPSTEKAFSPKRRVAAEMARVPSVVPGAAKAVAELGLEKSISEAASWMLEPGDV